MNDVQMAAIAMGIDIPLFPTLAHLVCVGCGIPITGEAHDDDSGWLCDDCDEETEDDVHG
jgi:hypothetical protein